MAQQLKNQLVFTSLASGATVVLPHGLHSQYRNLIPDIVFVPSESLGISADATAVTITNNSGITLSGTLLVESWHTIERSFGNGSNQNLPTQPYIVVGGDGVNGGSASNIFVFRPGSMIPRQNVYNDWALLMAATPGVEGVKELQIDNTMELIGGDLSFAAGVVTYTAAAGAPAIAAAVAGQQLMIRGAADPGNNGHFFVATRISATQITFANASGVTDPAFAGTLTIFGGFTAIVPAAGMPSGGWDLTGIEITAYTSPVGLMIPNQQMQFGGVASGGDVQFRNWLKTGGDLTVTSLNVTLAANIVGPGGVSVEWGTGFTGDTPNLLNNGTAPFWDVSTLGNTLTVRLDGRIGGTSPAFVAGNANYSPNPTAAFLLKGNSRLAANMVTGSNASAILNFTGFNDGISWGRQQNWAGSIVQPNTGWVRTFLFPAAVNQLSPVPATAALVFNTGASMNTVCSYNTTAGDITQQLPIIRAANPATGAAPGPGAGGTAGVLDSTGMFMWIDNQTGAHNVIVQPNNTTPDTFEDGSTSVIVPPGAVFLFQSDGISKWKIIGSRQFPTIPALLSGAGTLDITHEVTNFTSTGVGNAIVLPNGTYKGQKHVVVHSTVGGTGVITPATPGGNFTNATLTNHWDSFTFQWDGVHWNFATGFTGPIGLT